MKRFKSVSFCISSHKHAASHESLASFCPHFLLLEKKNSADDWTIYFIIEGGSYIWQFFSQFFKAAIYQQVFKL